MPCHPWHTDIPHRMHGWICTPHEVTACWVCGEPATVLCDYRIDLTYDDKASGRSPTCDAAMCPQHAATVGPDKHYCGAHFRSEEK